ncbi:NHL repeat-containing protein [Actinomadura rudentiformis]|uniref:PQQ-binding-like beta-propeller repeat protein n=1 Tax=Actinomadura rudentiformis TaxID=359158 RepID=A0A6H9YNQ0_9ACTN|nr:hypothetical protein [Actinomadura rudentiformis]KAB2342359.1 hypothetical protein F8566_38015 [Actinomadura rudentiformis]
MSDFDERLRATLADERWALPADLALLDGAEAGARRVRRRRAAGAVLGTLAAATAAVLAFTLVRAPEREPRPPRPVTSITLPVPGGVARELVLTRDSLYVLGKSHIYRIDRATRRVAATSRKVSVAALDLVMVEGTLWVSERQITGKRARKDTFSFLHRLDARTLQFGEAIPVPGGMARTTAVAGTLWSRSVDRFGRWTFTQRDPRDGRVLGTLRPPWNCGSNAEIADIDRKAGTALISCWKPDGQVIATLDLTTGGARAQLGVQDGTHGLTLGTKGMVWYLTDHLTHVRIHQVDVATMRQRPGGDLAAVRPAPPDLLTGVGGRLWLRSPKQGALTCYDGATGRRLASYAMPRNAGSLPVAGDEGTFVHASGGTITIMSGTDGCLAGG